MSEYIYEAIWNEQNQAEKNVAAATVEGTPEKYHRISEKLFWKQLSTLPVAKTFYVIILNECERNTEKLMLFVEIPNKNSCILLSG